MFDGQPPEQKPPKLLDQVRRAVRTRHMSLRTEQAYVGWAKRFVLFHAKRHPRDMDAAEFDVFQGGRADEGRMAVAAHHQALSACLI